MFIVKIKKQFNCPGNIIESAEWFDTQEEAMEFAGHNIICRTQYLSCIFDFGRRN